MERRQRAINERLTRQITTSANRRVGGTPETNRTSDLPLRRGLLYPLSYRGAEGPFYRIVTAYPSAQGLAPLRICTAAHRGQATR